jgi:hypothetical protein
MERDFSPLKVVEGLDLFEPERKQPGDEPAVEGNEPVAKRAGDRDAQSKKRG